MNESERLVLRECAGGFELELDGRLVVRHAPDEPFVRAGRGQGSFEMYRGNFKVSERLEELVALTDCVLDRTSDGITARFSRGGLYRLEVRFGMQAGRLEATFAAGAGAGRTSTDAVKRSAAGGPTTANRYRFSLPAEPEERVYGCGEQFSYFNLRGKIFPLWTSEQGVGRNKSTLVTFQADAQDRAGGDWWWTFYPQPTFVSSRRLWYHLETSAYASFDFCAPQRHELYVWDLPERLVIGAAASMLELVQDLSAFFGRQPELPDWAYDGVVLGIQGGTAVCLEKLRVARAAGVPVNGIFAQDWEGINLTSFGQRLRWNWVWNRERYPGLDVEIRRLLAEGVRFFGYANCYVGAGWSLFEEAARRGYLAKNAAGGDYLVDFGEFEAGIVDLTNPAAFEWYASVMRRELIDLGLAGWMADFGEYLPTDAVLHNGTSAELAHNTWPALWARCCHAAVEQAGRSGQIVYFMRAGFTGSQRWCPLMWAGDQNVDWSKDDGLPSVIPAALSLAMCGHGLHHSDIGGYTTLFGMKRTKELFMRWVEQAALTPFMRSHEGNRPRDNWQFDSDEETLAHLARMVRLHVALKPYLKACVAENARAGVPVMRPLFLHHEEDSRAWDIQDQYLLGADLVVAPVIEEGARRRRLHLPPGRWIHLWSGQSFGADAGRAAGADIEVDAALGAPPVFWREGSRWSELFRTAAAAAGTP